MDEIGDAMSGQTLSEKIFSRATKKEARAGEFVMAEIDCAMIHDITARWRSRDFMRSLAGMPEYGIPRR